MHAALESLQYEWVPGNIFFIQDPHPPSPHLFGYEWPVHISKHFYEFSKDWGLEAWWGETRGWSSHTAWSWIGGYAYNINSVQQQVKNLPESSACCFCCCTVPVFRALQVNRANIFIRDDLFTLPGRHHFLPWHTVPTPAFFLHVILFQITWYNDRLYGNMG